MTGVVSCHQLPYRINPCSYTRNTALFATPTTDTVQVLVLYTDITTEVASLALQ